jgi:hypothetical protein
MIVLSLIWLVLVLVELIWTTSGIFQLLGTAIWIVFIAEFVLRFSLAPRKPRFLRNNVVTIVALAAPALRFLNALRFLRLARGLRLVRIVGTANRGINALRQSFDRRGLGYVLLTTALVIALGAAGMMTFEPATEVGGGFTGYADALWWTAMLIATVGSGFWPESPEGRMLTLCSRSTVSPSSATSPPASPPSSSARRPTPRTARWPVRQSCAPFARRSPSCARSCGTPREVEAPDRMVREAMRGWPSACRCLLERL